MNLAGRSFGHIRVDRILGQGGMGDVYEGFDVRLARRVALKVLNPEGQLDEEARSRLIREARTLSKLDHPNICRIYDFIEEGDADVLVLELIDGRTLQEAMDDGLSTTDKLRIARDVASVLVAAHRAGIVHRDLKPENVMLTKSGVVKVLDFGLARWTKRKSGKSYLAVTPARGVPRLHVADEADATAAMPPAADEAVPNATAIGLTVGTPLFMSPEQARGEPLTTASDIYSFGLVLQALFTGKDPYPNDLNSREVMLRAAVGDSLPVTGVRHDVATLIKALKALAPSDRPTANDTLRRIEKIVDTPKRIARRAAVAILALVSLLGGWKYTVDLRRERTAAQKAEGEARQRRAQADSLIEFMLGDLRKKLEPVGRLDVLDDVGARSLQYFDSLEPGKMTPNELAATAKALDQLGEVRVSQGKLADGLNAFERAKTFAETALARAKDDPEAQLTYGTSHYWLGYAYRLRGDLPAALTHASIYRDVTSALATRYPSNDKYQLERAYGYSAVGTMLESQGKLADAAQQYRVVREIKAGRAAAAPADLDRFADLALTTNKIGVVLLHSGDYAGAGESLGSELGMLQGLLQKQPTNMTWKRRLATNCYFRGDLEQSLGHVDDAMSAFEQQRAITTELCNRDPDNTQWKWDLGIARWNIAETRRMRGDVSAALAELQGVSAELTSLLQRDPHRKEWQRHLVFVELSRARVLLELHRVADAAAALAVADRWNTGLSKDAAGRRRQALRDLLGGDIDAAKANTAAATAAWTRAADDMLALGRAEPDPRTTDLGARALLSLGRTADAAPLLASLDRIGHRHPDLMRLRR